MSCCTADGAASCTSRVERDSKLEGKWDVIIFYLKRGLNKVAAHPYLSGRTLASEENILSTAYQFSDEPDFQG